MIRSTLQGMLPPSAWHIEVPPGELLHPETFTLLLHPQQVDSKRATNLLGLEKKNHSFWCFLLEPFFEINLAFSVV